MGCLKVVEDLRKGDGRLRSPRAARLTVHAARWTARLVVRTVGIRRSSTRSLLTLGTARTAMLLASSGPGRVCSCLPEPASGTLLGIPRASSSSRPHLAPAAVVLLLRLVLLLLLLSQRLLLIEPSEVRLDRHVPRRLPG